MIYSKGYLSYRDVRRAQDRCSRGLTVRGHTTRPDVAAKSRMLLPPGAVEATKSRILSGS
ncbi:hypothetical protein Pa4123_54590 [Phytohabitans aurantiacus]|uniref:Uncharacterized protein n=1 Tax=Phytohabitans aurantiacus TaxID=3016789 RepID=A0ABQ5R1W0_9ACTN|nr:hypothetical protein Pa4123_54590 [Phytohabitans aurantiacus]